MCPNIILNFCNEIVNLSLFKDLWLVRRSPQNRFGSLIGFVEFRVGDEEFELYRVDVEPLRPSGGFAELKSRGGH